MPESRAPRAPKRANAHPRASLWHRVGRGALLAVAGVLPWFFLPLTAAPAAHARFLLAAVAATAGLVALLADTVERRRLSYPGSLAGIGVLAVALATAVAAIFSDAPSLSLFGGLLLADSLAHVVVAAVLFVLASAFLTERGDYVRLAAAFVGGAGLASLLGILGLFGVPGMAPYAPAAISELGFVAVLALGFACLAPFRALGSRAQAALLASGGLCLLVLAFMNFRILWAAVALIALFAAATGFVRKASITVPLALSLVALVFVLVGSRFPTLVTGSVELRPGTALTLDAVRGTLSGADAITGTGPGTFSYAYAENRPAAVNESRFWAVRFDQGVSYLATVPVTTGILGVLAWLTLLAGAVLLMRRRLADPAAPYAVLAVALAGAGLLFYPGSFTELALGGIALGALVGIAGERRTLAFPERSAWPLFLTFLALIVVTAGSLAGLYLTGQRYAAAAYYAAGSKAVAEGRTDEGAAKVARAASLDAGSDLYQRGLSQAFLARMRETAAAGADQRQAQEALEGALQAAQRAVSLNPADPANWANLGGLFEGLTPYVAGMDAQALAAYDEAGVRDPQSPAWPLARARTYAALARFQESQGASAAQAFAQAQEEAARALELKDDYADPRFLSARLYLASGETDRALARAGEIRARHGDDAGIAYQLGLLLYQGGLGEEARTDLERAVSLSPAYADARYFLGLAYHRLGRGADALAQFREIAATNPDNAEVRAIIGNLEGGRDPLEGIAEAPAATSTEEAAE